MNFRALGFVDASVFTSALVSKYRDLWHRNRQRQSYEGSPHHDTQAILLRGPEDPSLENWLQDVPQVDYALLKEWKSAQSLLARIRDTLQPLVGERPVIFGKVMAVRLKAGGHVDWHVDEGDYAAIHDRVHLCLLPSPGAFLYSGVEIAQPPVGQLTWFNNRALHSAVNIGPVPRVHLIVDIRKTSPDDKI